MEYEAAEAAVFRGGGEALPGAAALSAEDAADALFLEHAPRMRRVAIRKFGIPAEAVDELVQDVFVTYLVNPMKVHDLRAYLIGGICNASRRYWSKRAGEERHFVPDDEADSVTAPDDLFERLSVRLLVGATLARLSERCRAALRLAYRGEGAAGMAQALSTTPSNANYLVHVCRKRAREICEEIGRVFR